MPETRPKLLLVSESGGGGIREVVASLTRQLPALGWDVVTRFTAYHDRSELAEWLAARDLKAIIGPLLPITPGPLTWMRRALTFRGLVREHRPTLVNVHYTIPHVPAWDIAGLAVGGPPIVATCHIAARLPWRVRQSNRAGAVIAQAVTGVSAAVVEAMGHAGLARAKSHIIANGIPIPPMGAEVRPAPPAKCRPVVVGCAARLVPEKRVDVLIDAIAALSDLSVELAVAGDGPLREDLQRLAGARVPGRVHFLGLRRDMPVQYRQFDIFALTSDVEGLPLVALEAAAAGLPVVATAVPGTREAVEDGVSGIVVPVGDVGAVAAALRQLVTDPALRARMGAAGRARAVAEFSEGRMARDYDTLFRAMLAAGKR